MGIKLNLQKHCIETEIKRLYNQSLSEFFIANSDKNMLEKRISILQYALEHFDFPYLRRTYIELAGSCKDDIVLIWDKTNRIRLKINDKEVEPFESP